MLTNTPLSFVAAQVMNMQPLTLPVWGAGLLALLADARQRRWRLLGIAFLVVAGILIANRTSRSAYLTPGYPMLLAAGGAWWESIIRRPAARAVCLVVLAIGGRDDAAGCAAAAGGRVRGLQPCAGRRSGTDEKNELGRLPQFFADRQGWERFVGDVGRAWSRLTPEERARAVVFTGNYGEAGAVERLGRDTGMVALSGHNNYWLWGPGDCPADPIVLLTRSPERAERFFGDGREGGRDRLRRLHAVRESPAHLHRPRPEAPAVRTVAAG